MILIIFCFGFLVVDMGRLFMSSVQIHVLGVKNLIILYFKIQ